MLERCFLCSLLPNPTNEVFCCVRFIYTYPTKQLRCSVPDLTPSFVQGAVSYVPKPVINIYPVSCHFRICPQKVRFSRLVVLMRRFLHSWFFRCIAYFCLICCIFVNCSPIRAQAVILETILAGVGIVTGSILRGLGMGQDFTQQVLTRIF